MLDVDNIGIFIYLQLPASNELLFYGDTMKSRTDQDFSKSTSMSKLMSKSLSRNITRSSSKRFEGLFTAYEMKLYS